MLTLQPGLFSELQELVISPHISSLQSLLNTKSLLALLTVWLQSQVFFCLISQMYILLLEVVWFFYHQLYAFLTFWKQSMLCSEYSFTYHYQGPTYNLMPFELRHKKTKFILQELYKTILFISKQLNLFCITVCSNCTFINALHLCFSSVNTVKFATYFLYQCSYVSDRVCFMCNYCKVTTRWNALLLLLFSHCFCILFLN